MRNTCYYFVDDIETSFVINDIKRFSNQYENIVLFSTEIIDDKGVLPTNVTVIDNFIDWAKFNKLKIVINQFWTLIYLYLSEIIALKKFLPLKESTALLCSNIYKAQEVKRHLSEREIHVESDSLFYSFWFYDCIYLAYLKRINFAPKIICRAHGGDLFEERSSLKGKVLCRNFQLKYFENVFSVSKIGAEYLRKKYQSFQSKIQVSYLGSDEPKQLNEINKDLFTLVSCANIRDIKRVYIIAEALIYIDFPMVWYHLGDQNLDAHNDPTIEVYKQNMLELKNNSNVQTIQLGQLANEEIFEFYRNTPCNLFISLSETEGIPVSMMEAISFGIPILSTDVGGCNEIVNHTTGILFPENISGKLVAKTISDFRYSTLNTDLNRIKIKNFWEEFFNQNTNYSKFFEQIK